MKNAPIYLEAEIKVHKENDLLKEKAASVIDLPSADEKQLDLMYFSAIFVSSGANLNYAFFEPSELLLAENTVVNKALDIEHKEKEIIGHIYDRVFIDDVGNVLDVDTLRALSQDDLNNQNVHIAVAGIIYKNRFPEVAEEVAAGKWKVSMEAYYNDFDIKIGDLVLSKEERDFFGLGSKINEKIGKVAKVIKNNKIIAFGNIYRILRNITFSGCGIVENPANPPSIILEVAEHKYANDNPTAVKKEDKDKESVLVLDYDEMESNSGNKVTSKDTEGLDSAILENQDKKPILSELQYNDTVGICVNYKKRVKDKSGIIIHENWCTLFDTTCTSFSRSADDPKCLKNVIASEISKAVKRKAKSRRIDNAITVLNDVLKVINKEV